MKELASFFKTFSILLIGFAVFFAFPASPIHAQSGCSIEVLTPVVDPNTPIRIRLNNIPYTPGSQIDNHRFTIYSPATNRWIDIGDLVEQANSTTVEIEILLDNTGLVLFPPSGNTTGYTISLTQSEFLDIGNTTLCSLSNAIRVRTESVVGSLNLCDTCNAQDPNTGTCATGLECKSQLCLPTTSGSYNSVCLNNDDCNDGLICQGAIFPGAWCESRGGSTTPPGRCVNAPQDPPIFTCANRGGQCASIPLSAPCIDNVARNTCENNGNCWINPQDPTGISYNTSMRGSCVTRRVSGCGLYEQSCCRDENPDGTISYTCEEGTPSIGGGELQTCYCEGGNKQLGEQCDEANQCLSGNCFNGKCALAPNSCSEFINSSSLCGEAGGILCDVILFPGGAVGGQITKYYCCTSAAKCEEQRNAEPPPAAGVFPVFSIDDLLCRDKKSIDSAIGCIPIQNAPLYAFLIRWGVGIAGGVAFLLIIIASIIITTSTGDPKRLQAGRELLTSAVIGLIIIIFTVFILRLLGVNILNIPIFS